MRIYIKTEVFQTVTSVWQHFDKNLLLKLAPPFPPFKVLRYDGQNNGDIVSFELNFFLFKQHWESVISDANISETQRSFIDNGRVLPFFLKAWKHTHLIEKNVLGGSFIIDAIEFKTPFIFTDYLLYPILYLQFLYRKPIYKKVFS